MVEGVIYIFIYMGLYLKHREAFAGFDPNIVSKMGEKEITDIASDKAIMLAESRVRSIVDNAKCILKASFSLFCHMQMQ